MCRVHLVCTVSYDSGDSVDEETYAWMGAAWTALEASSATTERRIEYCIV
jgi:hypothetical protein